MNMDEVPLTFRRPRSPVSEASLEEDSGSPSRKKKRTNVKQKKSSEPKPRGLREKLGDLPLRLIIIGHNPSAHAWRTGHYYSNPSNRMWPILKEVKIAPDGVHSAEDDDQMIPLAGVGFTDVGCGVPGTDSSQFSFKIRREWSEDFLKRIRNHIQRSSDSIGCRCGECGAPHLIAFAGKTHYVAVHNATCVAEDRIKTATIGKQPSIPLTWRLPEMTEVWVLPSTSGASALTNAERVKPFEELAARLREFRWPEKRTLKCEEAKNSDGEYT